MPKTYEPIATANGTGASGTITFTSIPATYTDLVLVFDGANSTADSIFLYFNNDTSSNYSLTRLYGDGSSAASDRTTLGLFMSIGSSANKTLTTVNIMNYTNTTTFKTVLLRINAPAGFVASTVGLWRKTPEAINRVDVKNIGGFITAATTVTLYGIKAA